MPTKVTSVQIVNSSVDSSPLGGSTPSTAVVTTLLTTGNLSCEGTAFFAGASFSGLVGANEGLIVQGALAQLLAGATVLAPSSNDNSTRVPSTAWVQALLAAVTQSLTQNGYIELPGGLVIQWGRTATGNPEAVTFPIAFPNACFVVVATPYLNANTSNYVWVGAATQTGFNIYNNGTTPQANWIAIGY